MRHVLIREDEFLVAEYLGSVAELAGAVSVSFATTETEAIQIAHLNPPSTIISDVNLAAGTGPNAVKTIRREHGIIPVIFVTASPESIGSEEACTILTKPVPENILLDALRAWSRFAG